MTKYYFHMGKLPIMARPVTIFPAFDRTRTLFDCPDILPICEIGRVVGNIDFHQVCDDRASQIVGKAKADGKRLAVFWSGGIDSTLALVALRKHGIDDRLTVVMNEYSIAEYPFYYDQLQRSSVNFAQVKREDTADSVPNFLKDHYVVTGEIGDQVFGSVKYKDYPDYSLLAKPWKQVLKFSSPFALELFERFTAACPAPVHTVKEFWWWLSYAVKYQGVCFRMLLQAWDARLEENVFHFFHTPEFNDWSVSTPMELKFFGTDERQYKWLAKEYIYRETNDADYRDNKLKEVSLLDNSSAKGNTEIKWVDTNWNKG